MQGSGDNGGCEENRGARDAGLGGKWCANAPEECARRPAGAGSAHQRQRAVGHVLEPALALHTLPPRGAAAARAPAPYLRLAPIIRLHPSARECIPERRGPGRLGGGFWRRTHPGVTLGRGLTRLAAAPTPCLVALVPCHHRPQQASFCRALRLPICRHQQLLQFSPFHRLVVSTVCQGYVALAPNAKAGLLVALRRRWRTFLLASLTRRAPRSA